jgi:hypothetical protein
MARPNRLEWMPTSQDIAAKKYPRARAFLAEVQGQLAAEPRK